MWRTQGKPLPRDQRERPESTGSHGSQSPRSGRETSGIGARRNAATADDGVPAAPCGQAWGLKPPGRPNHRGPQYGKVYLQELNGVSTVNIKEKPPLASGRGKRKGNILKYAEQPVLKEACPQEKPVNQCLTWQDTSRALTHPGKGSTGLCRYFGSVSVHSNKVNITIKQVTQCFWFPSTYKHCYTIL